MVTRSGRLTAANEGQNCNVYMGEYGSSAHSRVTEEATRSSPSGSLSGRSSSVPPPSRRSKYRTETVKNKVLGHTMQ